LREVAQGVVRYRVLLRVPRAGGLAGWGASSGRFEAILAAQQGTDVRGAHVIAAEVEAEQRRGRDHVTVTVAISVSAADTGAAFAAAWHVFGEAAAADPAGWDVAGAAAEIAPVARLGPG
jgi:hypothetical protein